MCAPSPPPPPDYTGAAQAQGAANLDTAIAQGHINNPNVINPYGRQTVTWEGNQPTVTQQLSPEQQNLYDTRTATQQQLAELAGQGAGSLRGLIGSSVNFDNTPQRAVPLGPNDVQLPTVQGTPATLGQTGLAPNMPAPSEQIRQNVIDAMMSRTNTDLDKRKDQLNSDLVAQGIRPGTAAYQREMDLLERSRNDARTQAELAAGTAAQQAFGEDLSRRQQAQSEQGQDFSQGLAAGGQTFNQQGQRAQLNGQLQSQYFGQENQNRRDAIAELLAQRQTPLNEIAALMSGSQVSNPFSVPNYAQNTQVAPPPIFGAAQAQANANNNIYNAQAGMFNSGLSGLATLGGSALGAFF